MRTDKQIYKVFRAHPEWFFELTKIESPGPCIFRSLSMKEVNVTADGVIEPRQSDKEWFVVEFQARFDYAIYPRLAMEMALLQKEYPERKVVGVIIFLNPSLDPKTEPWCHIVKSEKTKGSGLFVLLWDWQTVFFGGLGGGAITCYGPF